jgi:hypothetical protein
LTLVLSARPANVNVRFRSQVAKLAHPKENMREIYRFSPKNWNKVVSTEASMMKPTPPIAVNVSSCLLLAGFFDVILSCAALCFPLKIQPVLVGDGIQNKRKYEK